MGKAIIGMVTMLILLVVLIVLGVDTTKSVGDCYDELHNKIIGLQCEVETMNNGYAFYILAIIEMIVILTTFMWIVKGE